MKRSNPWTRLPTRAPFVLADDALAIKTFNGTAKPAHAVDLSLPPVPYVGRPDAPVVLLNLNPGMPKAHAEVMGERWFLRRVRANLRHDARVAYPFYFLDPCRPVPGFKWWSAKLKPLIKRTDAQTVSRRVLCVERFPYHSVKFKHGKIDLPSLAYTAALVCHALERDAVIIVMRGWRPWLKLVPELDGAANVFRLANPQNPTISPGNCGRGWRPVVSALR